MIRRKGKRPGHFAGANPAIAGSGSSPIFDRNERVDYERDEVSVGDERQEQNARFVRVNLCLFRCDCGIANGKDNSRKQDPHHDCD